MPSIDVIIETTPVYITVTPQTNPNIQVKFGAVDSVNGETGVVLINAVPNGGTTGQVLAKNSNTDNDTGWINVSAGGGTWGSITGTLSDQTDLQAALDDKEDTANKQTNLTPSATKYPTVNAVNTGLALKANLTDVLYTKTLFKNITQYIHTGTTAETKIFSFLIPANTIQDLDQLRLFFRFAPTNNVNNKTVRIYLNTVDVLPTSGGVQQIAINTFSSAVGSMIRNMWQQSPNLYQILRAQAFATDDATTFNNGMLTAITFDPTVDQYLIVSAQLTDGSNSIYFWNAYGLLIRS